MCRASNIFQEPSVPSPSTMPIYDPKGTRWASYTTRPTGEQRAATNRIFTYLWLSLPPTRSVGDRARAQTIRLRYMYLYSIVWL